MPEPADTPHSRSQARRFAAMKGEPMPEEFPHESIVPFQHHRAVVNAVEAAHSETRRKLAKAEHDRDRYADRIESLRAENAALRAKLDADRPAKLDGLTWDQIEAMQDSVTLSTELEQEGDEHDAE